MCDHLARARDLVNQAARLRAQTVGSSVHERADLESRAAAKVRLAASYQRYHSAQCPNVDHLAGMDSA